MTILSAAFTYSFIRLLVTPWAKTKAYQFGIIDAQGNPLKKSSQLKTAAEKDSYTMFNRLVFKIKRLLGKLPAGKTLLGSYAAALWLLKEHVKNKADYNLIEQEFLKFVDMKPELNESTSFLQPGTYVVTNPYLEGIRQGTIIESDALCLAMDNVLGEDIFDYNGYPIARSDLFRLYEDVTTTGPAMAGINPDDTPGPAKPPMKRKKFCGQHVFECNHEMFERCRCGKHKYSKYENYIGDDAAAQQIREFAEKYPFDPIILQHSSSGYMMYLRPNR